MWSRVIVSLAFAASLHAQGAFTNPDFEKGSPGAVPEGWFAPPALSGYPAASSADECKQGKGCAEIAPGPNTGATPGNLMQMFHAASYRGKQIRYRAAVNVAPGARAGLWLRIDRPGGTVGFFDNMASRPIMTQGAWQYFEIDGFVHADAETVALGVLVYGGKARIDDASLTITGDLPVGVDEPARVMTDAGVRNLTAFGKLYGIVRFFHTSDEAAAANWSRVALEGVRQVETAASPADLAAALQAAFAPLAPTIRVFTGADPKPSGALSPTGDCEVIRWHNRGLGQAQAQAAYNGQHLTALERLGSRPIFCGWISGRRSRHWRRWRCSKTKTARCYTLRNPWRHGRPFPPPHSAPKIGPPASPMS